MLTLIIVIAMFAIVAYLGRKAMENPKPLAMDTDERRIGEMFGKTRDVTLSGFTTAGSAYEGKLILTNKRLIYTRYDEKRHALSITPQDLLSVEVTEAGLLGKTPALKISCNRGSKKKPKTITWTIPSKAKVSGNLLLLIKDKSYENPNTPATFAPLLEKWRTGSL